MSRAGDEIARGIVDIKRCLVVFKGCSRCAVANEGTPCRAGGCLVAVANAGDGGNSARPRVELRASSPNPYFQPQSQSAPFTCCRSLGN